MSKWKQDFRKSLFDKQPCHTGPVEIIENLFCGSEDEALLMAAAPIRVDTLVPLNRLNPTIWDTEFRGEILYCPVEDFGILPDDVLDKLVSEILERLKQGLKVGMFCMGGHGRTGYVASVVLGRLGYKDPIRFLRDRYCREAVESNKQVQHIAYVLGKPELAKKYKNSYEFERITDLPPDYYGFYDELFTAETADICVCGDCAHFRALSCRIYEDFLFEASDPACDEFKEK